MIGPVYRQLQAVAIDLATASTLLNDCVNQFSAMRTNVSESWQKLYAEAQQFAAANEVSNEFPMERHRKKKKMDDELLSDSSLTGRERFKVDVYISVLDEVLQQLKLDFWSMT